MSELTRSSCEYSASVTAAARPLVMDATHLDIEESQPRPALEMTVAMALLLEGQQEIGGDPYNAIGRSARRSTNR